MNKKFRVAILSLAYNNWNFGGMLQAYALKKKVEDILNLYSSEYEVNQLRLFYQNINLNEKKGRIKYFIGKQQFLAKLYESIQRKKNQDVRVITSFKKFQKEKLSLEGYYNCFNIKKANNRYDCFITGSDQVWNLAYFNDDILKMFGLLFAEKNKTTISYAASIGTENYLKDRIDIYKEIIEKIDFVSVREETAAIELNKISEKDISVNADPTLLLTSEEWNTLIPEKAGNNTEPFIFAYFLNEKENSHYEAVKNIASFLSKKMIVISDESGKYTRECDREIKDAGPQEFLYYLKNSNYVVTNSFHGIIFSIIFNKQFIAFRRHKEQDYNSMNHRITGLLKDFALESRLFNDSKDISNNISILKNKICFELQNDILEEKRNLSYIWLRDSLEKALKNNGL